jgi:hypothetical protein
MTQNQSGIMAFKSQHVLSESTMPPVLTLAIAATAAVVIGTALPALAASRRKGKPQDK